jgi:hypothetical protein
VKYDFLNGPVNEFRRIHGIQVEGSGEAQVLLPQWVGAVQIPAYVKVKK